MKWYRKTQIANEKLAVDTTSELRVHKKHTHVKQILYPETSGMLPLRRPKNHDYERQFREKVESAADLLTDKKVSVSGNEDDYLRRKIYREEADDEEVLGSVENYLNKYRAREILAEEALGETLKFRGRAELRKDDEPFEYRRVKVPDRRLAGRTLEELNSRRDDLQKRTKRSTGVSASSYHTVSEEDELLRLKRVDIFKYENGPDYSQIKGTAWRRLEEKYNVGDVDEDEDKSEKRVKPRSHLASSTDIRKTRVEKYDEKIKKRELSPEPDYMKTLRKRIDPELDELEREISLCMAL